MKHIEERKGKRKTGRPLSFDRDTALERAMLLFWRHGYEATSLADLTSALGVTPPSIYAAFGDKKQLFLEAVDRYLGGATTSNGDIDDALCVREVAFEMMRQAAIGFTGETTPPGCLLATGAISCSEAAKDVQLHLANIRLGIERRLAKRIADAVAVGQSPETTDASILAAHVMAVIQGMSTLARDGAPREKLLRIVDMAMKCWPNKASADGLGQKPAVAKNRR